ncbi:MAG: hypothetical protein JRF21_10560 [Deltaproteobacteria bacterium]|nr:hypothetical protein [Deltaproteobacteria bacterium]
MLFKPFLENNIHEPRLKIGINVFIHIQAVPELLYPFCRNVTVEKTFDIGGSDGFQF